MGRNNRPNPFLETFEALLVFLEKECKEPLLSYQLKHFAHLISYEPYKIVLRLSSDKELFASSLKKVLDSYTEKNWIIDLKTEGGKETLIQKKKEEDQVLKDKIMSHSFIQSVLENFPDAKIRILD